MEYPPNFLSSVERAANQTLDAHKDEVLQAQDHWRRLFDLAETLAKSTPDKIVQNIKILRLAFPHLGLADAKHIMDAMYERTGVRAEQERMRALDSAGRELAKAKEAVADGVNIYAEALRLIAAIIRDQHGDLAFGIDQILGQLKSWKDASVHYRQTAFGGRRHG